MTWAAEQELDRRLLFVRSASAELVAALVRGDVATRGRRRYQASPGRPTVRRPQRGQR